MRKWSNTYYENNKDGKVKDYLDSTREHRLTYGKNYYEIHKDERAEYYQEHRKERIEYQKEYYRKIKEKRENFKKKLIEVMQYKVGE